MDFRKFPGISIGKNTCPNLGLGVLCFHAPVAQWIEQWPPEPRAVVRFHSGAVLLSFFISAVRQLFPVKTANFIWVLSFFVFLLKISVSVSLFICFSICIHSFILSFSQLISFSIIFFHYQEVSYESFAVHEL